MFAGDNTAKQKEERRKAAFTAAFLLAAVLLYLTAGVFFDFFIPCPFRTFTGLRCPGCGLSHAAGMWIDLVFLVVIIFWWIIRNVIGI